MKTTNNKPKRPYRLITPETVARHKVALATKGNGSAAVLETDPDYLAPHDRAYRILKKSEEQNTLDYIDDSLQQIGAEAVQELGELVHSPDQRVRTRNVHYAIDHLRGKAVQKNVSLVGKLNIQSLLD